MLHELWQYLAFFILINFHAFFFTQSFSGDNSSLLFVSENIRKYAINTVQPVINSDQNKDKLLLLLSVSKILHDSKYGVNINEIEPKDFIIYDKLDKINLGFLISFTLKPEQKIILPHWHSKYMTKNPADVFFAPSADEIIKTKAAFGCSHYARAFIAIVKALDLVDKPDDLRYVVSCKADNYNQALGNADKDMTINGHQFVLVKIISKWIAINTSKSEWTALPVGFSPDVVKPPQNISIRFKSYPDVIFLLRKIGKDYNDDCSDNSLSNLMNIYRSGDAHYSDFKWDRFTPTHE